MPTSLASNIQTQDYQYAVQVPQGTWRWKTRVDVSKSTPQFLILDVSSPFGFLRDNIPIPGTVIQAMAQSITDLQSAFAPSIVAAPTTLTFTLNQGQGFGTPQTITVSNGGTYGSLLAATATTDAAYVQVNPANVASLAFNASGQLQVSVDSTNLLATASPYTAHVTIQDVNAPNSPVVIPVTINVLPLAIISLSPGALNFSVTGNGDGTFPPVPAQTFQVQNTGPSGSVLNYRVQRLIGNSPWLVSFSPTSGTLNSGAAQTTTVVVQTTQNMMTGTYTETLRVSGYSSNSFQDLPVTFTVM